MSYPLEHYTKHAAPDDGMQTHIDAALEIKEVAADGTFTGYGGYFNNVDLDRDVILPGAFAGSLKKKGARKIKMLWQHDTRQPIGVWDEMTEDKRGLLVKGRLLINQGVPKADEAYALLKAGAIDSMSIGFSTTPDDWEIDEKRRIRNIKSLDLWEVSLVTFPANNRARVTRVKTSVPFQDLPLADRGRAWDSAAAESRVRQWAGGGTSISDMDWDRYHRAFLWYDGDSAENVTSYKLGIADIVNGELTAIPRGIFASAGVLLGARGGVDIPEEAKMRAISHLERYYSKMDLESPFKSIDIEKSKSVIKSYVAANLAAAETAKDYEQALREVGFSASEAKAITAKIGPQREVEAAGVVSALKVANAVLTNLNRGT